MRKFNFLREIKPRISCHVFRIVIPNVLRRMFSYSVVVITLDFESRNLGSKKKGKDSDIPETPSRRSLVFAQCQKTDKSSPEF